VHRAHAASRGTSDVVHQPHLGQCILGAVLLVFEGRYDKATTLVWRDCFVTPQHASAGPSKPSSWWMGTFKQSIARIGRLKLQDVNCSFLSFQIIKRFRECVYFYLNNCLCHHFDLDLRGADAGENCS
jgi:hypothetical protein